MFIRPPSSSRDSEGAVSPRPALAPTIRPRGVGLCLVRLIAAVVMALWSASAEAGIADQVGATFGLMIQDVVSAFPPVEGMVVAVEGDRIYLDLTEKDGVQLGQEFTIFRKGEVFRHPITGKVLGRYEEILGHARVSRALPQFTEATYMPLPDMPPARPEDGVRITRGRIRVAVAPPTDLTAAKADLRRVPFMLAHALSETKRFQSADPSAVQELLLNQKTRSEELLVRPDKAVAVARPLEVAGWLVPVLARAPRGHLSGRHLGVRGYRHRALLAPARPDQGGDGGRATVPVGAHPRGLVFR